MGLPLLYHLQLYQGDTASYAVTVVENGVPKDFSGFEFLAQVKKDPRQMEADATFDVTYDPGMPGRLAFTLASISSRTLTEDLYHWDIRVKAPDGSVTTYLYGQVRVEPMVADPWPNTF